MNHEGYQDPTAERALRRHNQMPYHMRRALTDLQDIASLFGFDIITINKDKYGIRKHRYLEVIHHCLQYPEWREELENMTDTVKAIQYGQEGKGSPSQASATECLAIKRAELQEKCERIEQTAIEADADIYQWLLEGVTTDYATYIYLRDAKGLPCGNQKYYRARRKFYWLMSKKI